MSLPLPATKFYRMADVNPATADAPGIIAALLSALQATVDWQGVSLAASYRWTATDRDTGKAISVTPPAGTPMTQTPGWLIAASAADGSPTSIFKSPDTFTASNVLLGMAKSIGAYTSWNNAQPFTTAGSWSGYMRAAGTTWNATTAKVRVYISQEQIFVQLVGATVTQQAWFGFGATVEPSVAYATSSLDAEPDDRLYGMWTSGNGAATTGWLSSNGTTSPWNHGASNGNAHGYVFQPGTNTLFPIGRKFIFTAGSSTAEAQTSGGTYVGDLMPVVRAESGTPNGARMGMVRGVYPIGLVQSGKTNTAYHAVSMDTSAVGDSVLLPIAP